MSAGERFLPTTSYALLGLLSFGRELTGYELKQWADGSIRFFAWSPAMSQVYTELARLARLGFVAAAEGRGSGRSGRRYHITAHGLEELTRWLAEAPVEAPVLKHPAALRVFFGHLVDRPRLRAILDEHRARLLEQLEALDAIRADLADDPTWRHARLVAGWGERLYRHELETVGVIRRRLPVDTTIT